MAERQGFGFNRPVYADPIFWIGGGVALAATAWGFGEAIAANGTFMWPLELLFAAVVNGLIFVTLPLVLRGWARRLDGGRPLGAAAQVGPRRVPVARLRVHVLGGTVTFTRDRFGRVAVHTADIPERDRGRALGLAHDEAADWLHRR